MAKSYRPVDREQTFLLPPDMKQWLPEDHLVWFVIDVVKQVDTKAFHASRRLGWQGRRGYDPDMLLALLVYAYAVGQRSSRKIEKLCVDHVAFRVLCGQDPPDHSTLSRFRAEHDEALVELFAQVLRLCGANGMGKVGVIAIDGTKIAANASRGANRKPDTIREEARRIAEEIITEAAVTDQAEDAAAAQNDDSDTLPPGFASHSGRAANIAAALEELDRQDAEHAAADAGDEDRNEQLLARLAAGESIRGAMPTGIDPVRYWTAKLTGARLILERLLAAHPDGTPGHRGERKVAKTRVRHCEQQLARAVAEQAAGKVPDLRGPTARRRDRREAATRARGGRGRVVNPTDPDSRLMTAGAGGGSLQGFNAQFGVSDDHIIIGIHTSQDANDTCCYTPTLAAALAGVAALGLEKAAVGTVLADAGYFTEKNLTSNGPARLIAAGKKNDIAAKTEDSLSTPVAEQMRERLKKPENAQLYKRRSATVEPVFAHLKDQIGLRRFARRGLQAVNAELHLAATALNLNRLHRLALSTP